MTVLLVRLSTGEDLLAEVAMPISASSDEALSDDLHYVLKKPMRILAQPGPDGKLSVGLGDFPPFGVTPSKEVTMLGSKIMFMTSPNPQLIPIYKQATSALTLPTAPSIKLV